MLKHPTGLAYESRLIESVKQVDRHWRGHWGAQGTARDSSADDSFHFGGHGSGFGARLLHGPEYPFRRCRTVKRHDPAVSKSGYSFTNRFASRNGKHELRLPYGFASK